jgi:general secretion pathway protein A
MYKAFYNLGRNPFEITPDPSFLFPTRKHNEALASLYYGVRRRKGFVVMTGEVGTGKTLLVRVLLQLLNLQQCAYAYVFNSRLSPADFLRYVARDFGLATTGKAIGDLWMDVSAFLVTRHRKKMTTVLVVDEAHHLSADVLEEIRLLTNLETTDGKLLQILLVGQPELDEKLDSFELRQLKQRIAHRSHLEPLTEAETREYIIRRLHLAGANSAAPLIFSPEASSMIYHFSRGFPRLINTICENALIHGYARQTKSISGAVVQDVANELRLGVCTPPQQSKIGQKLDDVEAAVKTMLAFSSYLNSMRKASEESEAAVAGVKER